MCLCVCVCVLKMLRRVCLSIRLSLSIMLSASMRSIEGSYVMLGSLGTRTLSNTRILLFTNELFKVKPLHILCHVPSMTLTYIHQDIYVAAYECKMAYEYTLASYNITCRHIRYIIHTQEYTIYIYIYIYINNIHVYPIAHVIPLRCP